MGIVNSPAFTKSRAGDPIGTPVASIN
jgi:hypothetical protein